MVFKDTSRPGILAGTRRPSLELLAEQLAREEGRDGEAQWPLAPVLVLFSLGWLAFSWPWLSGAVTIPWDAKAHFAPQIQFLAQSLARGESPFWLPYAFSGIPQIADPQSMMFSPPFLALALVNGNPSLTAIDTALLVALLAAGWTVIWLARDLGWHWGGALVAALGFCFGAAMAWRLQHFGQVLSLAYVPLCLLALRRGLLAEDWRRGAAWGALAGLVAAFFVLGRDQVGLLAVYVLAGFVVWQIATADEVWPAIRRAIAPLMAGGIVGAAAIALPILMTLLYAGQSNRPEIDFVGAGRGSLHPALLLTALFPHLYGAAGRMEDYWGPPSFAWQGTDLFIAQNVGQLYIGAPLLLLMIAGLVRGVLFRREIAFFSVVLGMMLLYALGWYTPAFRAFYEVLPGVNLYRRPADAVFLVGAFGALVAGYVAHLFLSGEMPEARPWQRGLEAGLVVLAAVLAIVLALRLDRLGLATGPLLVGVGWMAAAATALWAADRMRLLRPVLAALLLAGVLTVDLAVNNGPNGASAMATGELDMLQPESRSPTLALLKARTAAGTTDTHRPRVELAGLGFHWPNASLTHRLEHTLGYNPVRPGAYSRATGAGDTVGLPDQRKFVPLFPSYRSTLADLLGLRFIATGVPVEEIDKALKPGDLRLIARTADGYVYENPRAMPRVLFARRAVVADFEAMIAAGRWPEADLTDTVVLEAAAAGGSGERRPGTARIAAWHHGEVVLEVDSPDGGWVVLHDPWQPWWRASVDGQPAEILKANVLFRAVAVAPGRHQVRFSFTPVRGALAEITERAGARPSRALPSR